VHPPPLHHGAIGNGRVLALVAPTSAIEWLCLPRFDSPSVFGRLLDAEHGGTFRVLGRGKKELAGTISYLPNTNVLSTRFVDGDDEWEVIDFAPRVMRGTTVDVPIEIIRLVRPIRGVPHISFDLDPRPDYARAPRVVVPSGAGLAIEGAGGPLTVFTNLSRELFAPGNEIPLRGPVYTVITWGRRPERPTMAEINLLLDETIIGWRTWAKSCALPWFAAEKVLRSALCLKLHAFHDTGAIIAAATTSIPEAMGTPRTWDYRYCWLRDAAFVVEALRRLSHLSEGEQFIRFLRDVADAGPLQPLYGLAGERDVPEIMLPHLAGFGGNGHVRIGNAAAIQKQHDLMGELVLCLETMLTDPRLVVGDREQFFTLIERMVEDAIQLAPVPDMGIWEFRTLLRPYTFSRAMCWAAIDRGAAIARKFGRASEAARWAEVAEREKAEILTRAFNPELKMFTQALDGTYADAANLLLPTIGIIDARDPRFLSTLDAYERDLGAAGLLRRYVNPDDFGATHSAFTICAFWWAEALALAGRLDEAIAVFERVCRFANSLGLFSEDVDPATGQLLGNFPQAYTHVGLVHAACTISEILEVREGRTRAWV
jgi:GH15 family glucan-1,4-alpha-glucosidase